MRVALARWNEAAIGERVDCDHDRIGSAALLIQPSGKLCAVGCSERVAQPLSDRPDDIDPGSPSKPPRMVVVDRPVVQWEEREPAHRSRSAATKRAVIHSGRVMA